MGIRYTGNATVQRLSLELTSVDISGLIGNHRSMDIDSESGLIAVVGSVRGRTYRVAYRLMGQDFVIVNIGAGGMS